jgi:hypothetical protein
VMVLWPFTRAVREGQPIGLALRVLGEVARGARDILARRRQVRELRRISPREFRARLAPFGGRRPFTTAGEPGPVQEAGPR